MWFDDVLALIRGTAATPASLPQHVELQTTAVAAATPEELQLTQVCVQTIESDEGCRLTAYPDPGTGSDPWTIGYGHTGPEVHEGLVWTQAQADAALQSDLGRFKNGVSVQAKFDPRLSDAVLSNYFSAMVSLSYNIGLGNFHSSSVLRFHNAGQYQQAADAFLLWDKSAGNVMAGLVRRRHQEREMYLGLTVTESG